MWHVYVWYGHAILRDICMCVRFACCTLAHMYVYETWAHVWICTHAGIYVRCMHVGTYIYVRYKWKCYVYVHARDADVCDVYVCLYTCIDSVRMFVQWTSIVHV